MRIRSIKIRQWRHFQNVEIALPPDAPLVCVVGANGTGKTHLLELIAACAHRLGLSQGIEIPRGDPFADPHDFSLQFYLAEGVSEAVDKGLASDQGFVAWDRTLAIESNNVFDKPLDSIAAGGITDGNQARNFASRIIKTLQSSKDVHFLSLDSDRAYPKKNINIHEIAQAYEIDWGALEYTRGRSFKATATLYDEWIKSFLAQENQSGTQLMQGIRKANKRGDPAPIFEDPFEEYSMSLQKVLPHLLFTGVDPKRRTLLFDTTGLKLSFNQLSGGEREIAFLVGQIDRFRLREGLFLIDEPELHLNSDLIRTWVAYLTSTVSIGQIWLATHSLEAVEAAGQQATFILERNEATRKVDSLARLDNRPVLSALSRAVGTPAFSISQLRFVFVEGEEGVGERERYRKLANVPQDVRFMECGSCNEVLRRILTIKALAKEAGSGIRIGGVVDRDFRTETEASNLSRETGVFVLPVLEVENFFLHPETLRVLLDQNGLRDSPVDLILSAADERAGGWIFQHAMATPNAKSLPEILVSAKDRVKVVKWADLEADRGGIVQEIGELSRFGPDDKKKLEGLLDISANAYARRREGASLWKGCEGKQVLNKISHAAGFSGPPALMQAAFTAWQREDLELPTELAAFREYLAGL